MGTRSGEWFCFAISHTVVSSDYKVVGMQKAWSWILAFLGMTISEEALRQLNRSIWKRAIGEAIKIETLVQVDSGDSMDTWKARSVSQLSDIFHVTLLHRIGEERWGGGGWGEEAGVEVLFALGRFHRR